MTAWKGGRMSQGERLHDEREAKKCARRERKKEKEKKRKGANI